MTTPRTRRAAVHATLPPGEVDLGDSGIRLQPPAPNLRGRDKLCTVADCERPRRSRGLCRNHLDRARRWAARQQRQAARAAGEPK